MASVEEIQLLKKTDDPDDAEKREENQNIGKTENGGGNHINGTTEKEEEKQDVETTEKNEEDNKDAGTDGLLGRLGGCGLFQVILTLMFAFSTIPDTFTFRLTSFAVYNPGFKCLDGYNRTTTFANHSQSSNDSCSTDWTKKDCSCFDSCENIEFNPDIKTIVSEWGLACDRHFLLTTTLAASQVGALISNFLVGYIGDRFGRKYPLIIGKSILCVVNIALALSPTWVVHAVLFCLLNFVDSFSDLLILLTMEYVPADWRVKMYALPASTIFTTMFALTAMYTEDWKILRYVAAATGIAFLIPLIWIPKSLRWLSVNGRENEAYKVATRIAKMNKVEPPTKDQLAIIVRKIEDRKIKINTTALDLFRKGYRLPTFALACVSFALAFDFKVIALVISKLPGNIYTNIMISQAGDLPANVISYVLANRYRRKPTLFTFFFSIAVCFIVVVVMEFTVSEEQGRWPTIAIVMIARMFLVNSWMFLMSIRMEVYPTVARSNIISFCAFASAFGNIVSPFAIPKTPSTLWISYLSMAIVTLICACLIALVPETKGKPLKDTWDETNITLAQSFSKKYKRREISEKFDGVI